MPRTTALIDPGAMLAEAHKLAHGGPVRLRLARPTDASLVRDFLERLSPETRERRFLRPMPDIDEAIVRQFTFFDPRERMTMAATALDDGTETIVGLADATFDGTGVAEIGVVVEDEHQRRGVGTLLSEAIASLAINRGATHLKAQMHAGNAPMLKLFERLGRTVRSVEDGTETAYVRLSARSR
jgi:GNAT superfamily N-acetyltransferase